MAPKFIGPIHEFRKKYEQLVTGRIEAEPNQDLEEAKQEFKRSKAESEEFQERRGIIRDIRGYIDTTNQ